MIEGNELVMLPPYVAEEHRALLNTAEKTLEDYSNLLLDRIKKELFDYGWEMNPHPTEIQKAEQAFFSDPIRQMLIRQLGDIKMLVERPRFLIKGTGGKEWNSHHTTAKTQ